MVPHKFYYVGIVGGGASGILAAIQLLRNKPVPVVHIFNEGYEFGRGVAYSASSDRHVLNVRAGNMSAFPDQPNHFGQWLSARCPDRYSTDSFVPRHLYGDYLQETLQIVEKEAPAGHLHIYSHRVDHLEPRDCGYTIHGSEAVDVLFDAVILALGNIPPANPALSDNSFALDPRYLSNPWQEDSRLRQIRGIERVAILGSGLTTVDAILQLRQQGHRGKINVISRRGQWPSVHKPRHTTIPCAPPQIAGLSPAQAICNLRENIRDVEKQGGDWRQVIDSLRPETNAIWGGWTIRQRRSFLRHLRPYWDARRHRMAPEVWQIMEEEVARGTLQLCAGRIISILPQKSDLIVTCCRRYREIAHELHVDFVLNCTGSETLQRKCCPPLLRALLDLNLAELDPLGLGLLTTSAGAVLDANGNSVPSLFAIGPIRRGGLWETNAIPEIRVQAAIIAQAIF